MVPWFTVLDPVLGIATGDVRLGFISMKFSLHMCKGHMVFGGLLLLSLEKIAHIFTPASADPPLNWFYVALYIDFIHLWSIRLLEYLNTMTCKDDQSFFDIHGDNVICWRESNGCMGTHCIVNSCAKSHARTSDHIWMGLKHIEFHTLKLHVRIVKNTSFTREACFHTFWTYVKLKCPPLHRQKKKQSKRQK